MRKLLFGIFAHPDDEAFGPSGTLYKAAQDNTEIHLILVTDGAASTNRNVNSNLAKQRLQEWRSSGALIGANSMHSLNYPDGELSNGLYLEIAEKIMAYINKELRHDTETEIEFMTFEPSGLSGHLDHIAVSHITTYVYLKLRKTLEDKLITVGKLKYFCLPDTLAPEANTNWLYMPKGVPLDEIDEIIDISQVYEHKLRIMRTHLSQKTDMDNILARQAHIPDFKKEHFIYYK